MLSDFLLLLQNSVSLIEEYWKIFLYLIVFQLAFAQLIKWFLLDLRLNKEAFSILSFLGGILGLTFFCIGIVLLKIKPTPNLGEGFFFCALLLLITSCHNVFKFITLEFTKILAFFLFILLIRLSFIRGLLVPPYSDSIQHVLIVKDFLSPEKNAQAFYNISEGLINYYHFGFHALTAWLSGTTATSPEQTVMVLGQYFQALAILAIYPLAYVILGNSTSAWTVMSIAGFYLPTLAYASNWGKYPAIASTIGFIFTFTLVLLIIRKKNAPRKVWGGIIIAVLSCALLHSRSIFLLITEILAILIYKKILRATKKTGVSFENNDYIKMMIIFLGFVFLEFNPFKLETLYIVIFLGLIIISINTKFSFSIYILVSIVIMFIGLITKIDLPSLPNRFNTVFDITFLSIFLYIPVSFLVWSGLDGLSEFFKSRNLENRRNWLLLGVMVFGLVNTAFFQVHSPSKCCVLLSEDDLYAFEWIKQNIPKSARIGIAAIGKTGNLKPSDGGAWIENMISVPTQKIDVMSDFTIIENDLCENKVAYLYSGGLEDSFDEYSIIKAGGIYVYGLGKVHIYYLDCY